MASSLPASAELLILLIMLVGLVGYVFTNDLRRGLRFVEGIETGMVGLNRGLVSNAAAPFGGIKHSGFGREGGTEGIEEYLDTKYVAIDM